MSATTSIASSSSGQQLTISGSNQIYLAGTTRFTIVDFQLGYTTGSNDSGAVIAPYILGRPKVLPTSIIPHDFVADFIGRITLRGVTIIAIMGSGQAILTDDFGSRSRIRLVGSNV